MFKKILAYFDGSPAGRRAVKLAIYLAGITGTKLLIISSINPIDELDTGFLDYEEDIEKNLKYLMEDAQESGIEVESRILFGSPEDALVKTIDSEDPDLVVLPLMYSSPRTFFGRGEPLHSKLTNIYPDRGISFLVTTMEER
ncbi:MAG: universal stress protein [Thermotogae bacterium]|nr:universal stress protein [Thermotogota bacterium]